MNWWMKQDAAPYPSSNRIQSLHLIHTRQSSRSPPCRISQDVCFFRLDFTLTRDDLTVWGTLTTQWPVSFVLCVISLRFFNHPLWCSWSLLILNYMRNAWTSHAKRRERWGVKSPFTRDSCLYIRRDPGAFQLFSSPVAILSLCHDCTWSNVRLHPA